MFKYIVGNNVPRFLLSEKNGRALAVAIAAGLNRMNAIIADGVACLLDADTMPEWRLDELAWEYNIPYDYSADIEQKRLWIKNTYVLSSRKGTAAGVSGFLKQVFGGAEIAEWHEYGGQPYHFKVTLPGAPTQAELDWATSAVENLKSLRSVMDGYETVNAYTDETGEVLVDEVGPLYVES